jgi:hypothetical protein
MDHFGIGQAMRGMALAYFTTSRRSGRTTSLLESLKDGDRVVCASTQEAELLVRKCRDYRLKVACIVIDPKHPEDLLQHGTSEGRTVFDHTWVERFYLNSLEATNRAIDTFQRETSGYGSAHIETRRRAEERIKWSDHG